MPMVVDGPKAGLSKLLTAIERFCKLQFLLPRFITKNMFDTKNHTKQGFIYEQHLGCRQCEIRFPAIALSETSGIEISNVPGN